MISKTYDKSEGTVSTVLFRRQKQAAKSCVSSPNTIVGLPFQLETLCPALGLDRVACSIIALRFLYLKRGQVLDDRHHIPGSLSSVDHQNEALHLLSTHRTDEEDKCFSPDGTNAHIPRPASRAEVAIMCGCGTLA